VTVDIVSYFVITVKLLCGQKEAFIEVASPQHRALTDEGGSSNCWARRQLSNKVSWAYNANFLRLLTTLLRTPRTGSVISENTEGYRCSQL
jgi:hypothetical protein